MLPSRTDFWGAELTAKKKEVVWDAEIEGDEGPGDDPDIVHNLHIQRVILGANAKDEKHLVMITAENFGGEEMTHPLCWLSKESVSESQCSMHMVLPPPVTLQLAQGSGPVHVIGVWEQQLEDDTSYSSEEDEGDTLKDVMDSIDSKPLKDAEVKQKKRPASSPPHKPLKVAKKDDKISKPVLSQKKPTLNLMAEQDSDEDEDEDKDEEDSEQEEGEGDDDDDENEESDEEEEEESEEEPSPPPPKKKPQTKVITPKQKTHVPKSIGDKAAKKPAKGGTPQGSRSIDELKAALAKSPNVPKKREKFNNYLKNNLKVTDPDMMSKLWNFVQQSKH